MISKDEFVDSLVPLLKRGISFAAYCLPEENVMEFIMDDNISPIATPRKFIISTWTGKIIEIKDRDIKKSSDLNTVRKAHPKFPQRKNTTREEYENGLNFVTGLLRSTEGKVVLSRQRLLSDSRLNHEVILNAIYEMFRVNYKAFRAVYFTSETGAWCVCSPELLLHVDKRKGTLSTVALAGTRDADAGVSPWDNKNLREHSYVVRHIANVLKDNGVSTEISPQETLTTGDIQHILTSISGKVDCMAYEQFTAKLLKSLHPTPAICGYPVEWSRSIIDKVETHNRECYGGYIAIDDTEMFFAHVNLRCFAFEEGKCCFWGGGGIMPDSNAETEWNETELKIASTLSFIEKSLP